MANPTTEIASKSGGEGVTTDIYDLGSPGGILTIDYDMKIQKDQLDVWVDGVLVATTGGPVSDTGQLTVDSSKLTTATKAQVVVTGNESGTIWDYTINYSGGISKLGVTDTTASFFHSTNLLTAYLPYSYEQHSSSSIQTVDADGSLTNYSGNFVFNSNDDLLSGTVTSFEGGDPSGLQQFSFSSARGLDAVVGKNTIESNSVDGFFRHVFAGNDLINGSPEDDVVGGYAGNDTIDGGAGYDTVFLDGKSSDYQITTASDGSKVVKNISSGETDILKNIENYQYRDTTPAAVFSVTGAKSVDEGGNVVFTVALDTAQATPTTVQYAFGAVGNASLEDITGAPAVSGTSFTLGNIPWSGELTFAKGATTATITLPVAVDTIAESGEGVNLTLTSSSAGTALSSTAGIATTYFNDGQPAPTPTPTPTFSLAGPASVIEGDNAVYTVALSAAQATATTVKVTVNGVGAAKGDEDISFPVFSGTGVTNFVDPVDFENGDGSANAVLTFAPGATTAAIVFPVIKDTIAETGEGMSLSLSNPSAGVGISSSSNTVTTLFDDSIASSSSRILTGITSANGNNTPPFDASGNSVDFIVGGGVAYTYNIFGFGSDDRLLFGTNPSASNTTSPFSVVANNPLTTDGSIEVVYSLVGNASVTIATIHLTGVSMDNDARSLSGHPISFAGVPDGSYEAWTF